MRRAVVVVVVAAPAEGAGSRMRGGMHKRPYAVGGGPVETEASTGEVG